jgi:NAD+ diphosphatase
MKPPNFYAAGLLDRVGHRRKDAGWVAAALAAAETRFVALWRGQVLVRRLGGELVPALLPAEALAGLAGAEEPILLGVAEDAAHVAVDLSALDDPLDEIGLEPGEARFQELRAAAPMLAGPDAALLAYAKGLTHWHSRHRFCGVCGHATRSEEAGHVRRCTDPACATSHFPRTDPAVIMLVTDGERCLLGRQAAWQKGMYSTLAGFVEPGESLEEAVAREVFEEAGIEIDAIEYHSSQPWPFPASIMLGFHATARTTEIHVDQAELEDAQWFERDWLRTHRQGADFWLPSPSSISRRLIEDWLA